MIQILCILCLYVIIFVLDKFEMALSQSEKFARKRKEEAKHYKCIMEDPELHDARIEKGQKQYAAAKQKKNGKKPPMKVIEAQWLKWRTQKQNLKVKKQLELAASLNYASEFSI